MFKNKYRCIVCIARDSLRKYNQQTSSTQLTQIVNISLFYFLTELKFKLLTPIVGIHIDFRKKYCNILRILHREIYCTFYWYNSTMIATYNAQETSWAKSQTLLAILWAFI